MIVYGSFPAFFEKKASAKNFNIIEYKNKNRDCERVNKIRSKHIETRVFPIETVGVHIVRPLT